MDKKNLLEALKQVKNSGKKTFTQKVDLIINLKNINLKKPEDNIDLFTILQNNPGKKIKICALVNKDLIEKAKIFDKAINKEDFNEYQDKKTLKNLAKEFDFFIAQANLMTDVAKVFGKTLGPRNKMPNPKSGAVITQTTNLEELRTKLQKTIRLKNHDVKDLLYNFLSELIFLKDSQQLIFSKIKVDIKNNNIAAVLFGDKINPKKQELRNDIKAITLHMFNLEKTKNGYKATVIVDI